MRSDHHQSNEQQLVHNFPNDDRDIFERKCIERKANLTNADHSVDGLPGASGVFNRHFPYARPHPGAMGGG